MAAPAVTIDQLNQTLGAFVRQDYSSIFQTLMIDDFNFLDGQGGYVQLLDDVQDEINLTQLYFHSVLQPGNKDSFDPTSNAAGFKNRLGKVRPMKVDITFVPTQITALWKSHLGKMAAAAGQKRDTPYDIPFEQMLIAGIIKAAKNDVRLKALFKGVYDTTGTKKTPQDTVDGFNKIITDCVTSGEIPNKNIVEIPAITEQNAVDVLRMVADLIPGEFAATDLVMLNKSTNLRSYNRDYQVRFGSLPYNKEFKRTVLDDYDNLELRSEVSMADTNDIYITTKNNLMWLVNSYGGADKFIVEKEKRNLNLMMDFECAPALAMPLHVWVGKKTA